MKFAYNSEIFTNNDNISYYLLGCFITDGCVFKKKNSLAFALYTKDFDWIDEIRNIICPEMKIRFHNFCYEFNGSNKVITDWLTQNECIPKKSLIVKFPSIPDKFIFDFLRGVIDGDGSIIFSNDKDRKNYNKHVSICSASLDFINGVKNIFDQYEIIYNIDIQERVGRINTIRDKNFTSKNNMYKICVSTRNSYKLCKLLYSDVDCLKLNRKAENAFKIINHFEEKGLTLENFKTHKFNGDNSKSTKLFSEDINKIIDLWNQHPEDQVPKVGFYRKRIKDQYKVCETTFSRILKKYLIP